MMLGLLEGLVMSQYEQRISRLSLLLKFVVS